MYSERARMAWADTMYRAGAQRLRALVGEFAGLEDFEMISLFVNQVV